MILLMDVCQDSGILQTLYILKTIFKIGIILIPIIIIVSSMISFFKLIASNDAVDFKKTTNLLLMKIFIGVLIMFIPLIFKTLFSLIPNVKTEHGYVGCFENATIEKINYYRKLELEQREKAKAEEEKKKQEGEKNLQEAKQKDAEERAARAEAARKAKEQEAQEQNKNPNNDSPSINNPAQNTNYKGIVYIGDSRTVGMYTTITKSGSTSNVATFNQNNYWYASVGKSLNWFNSSAVPQIKSLLNNANYKVTIQMGANDLFAPANANSYVSSISSLASIYPNSQFIIISVNPIEDSKANNYSVRNYQVISFNSNLKNSIATSNKSNMKYCDVYSNIINNFSTTDGLHYTNATYQTIYNSINGCL